MLRSVIINSGVDRKIDISHRHCDDSLHTKLSALKNLSGLMLHVRYQRRMTTRHSWTWLFMCLELADGFVLESIPDIEAAEVIRKLGGTCERFTPTQHGTNL